ncbi:hypothetical protein CVT25_013991 [Psilocybe cyanescens]|uniref:RNase III domain-containing protein n=1 Tax=Psilocybe cyanescens TaxID=93625 RepID=A0A409XPN7_PSICY|nr:hypothetical protein CVT25_013991 [Psilocybe cyanescens]
MIGSLFPFKNDSRLDYIQREVVAFIQSPNYHFELPEISPQLWRQMNSDRSVAERLEFLGDAIMHSSLADGLNEHFPYEGPGFYTHVRSVLEANSTFAHLMIKVGSSSADNPVKAAGDIFESIMAAFHREQGSDVFGQYFRKYFSDLILRAGKACKIYQYVI